MLTLLLVAGSLGLSNFAASVAIGLAGVDRALRLRMAVVFCVFEAGMPVIGLLVGRRLSATLGEHAHLLGGALLIAVGAIEAVATMRGGPGESRRLRGAGTGRLIVLAAGLSVDNLIVGFALGAYRAPVALAVAVIAVVSVGLSLIGLELGRRLGRRIAEGAELVAAVVLIGVGVAITAGVF